MSQEGQTVEKRMRKPGQTDKEILDLLNSNGKPMRFHEIAKKLGYTSGKLQSAVKRLIKNNQIIKKKVPLNESEIGKSSGRTHVTLIFTKDFETDIIIPVKMNETTAKIISEVPKVSKEFENINQLVYAALIKYFQESITPETKIKAIEQAIIDGLLTKEKGDKLLGR